MIIRCDIRDINIPEEECLKCARVGDPPCAFTYGILKLLYQEFQPNPKAFRVTELTQCLRQTILKRKIKEFTVKPEDLYRMGRGTAIHGAIAARQEKALELLSEYKMEIKRQTMNLTGTLDEFDIRNGILRDYKDVAELPRINKPFKHHALQINIYKYMLEKTTEYKVKTMQIVYMDTYATRKINVSPIANIEQEVEDRLNILEKGLEKPSEVPPSIGWICSYCPKEIFCRCRAIILKMINVKHMKIKEIEEYIKNNLIA